MIYPQEQTNFPPLFDVVGCICSSADKILLLKRYTDKSYPGRWGIPGGKVKEKETRLRAMVRELFEETGLILSADNLNLAKTYHVITDEMSFLYTVYQCQFESIPKVRIRPEEHTQFGWFNLISALNLELIPDLDLCLTNIFFSGKDYKAAQLKLFEPKWRKAPISVNELEQSIGVTVQGSWCQAPQNPWYVSFGPPAAGKTTVLRAISKQNPKLQLVQDNTVMTPTSRLHLYINKAFGEQKYSFLSLFQMEILPVRFFQAINAPAYGLVDESIYSVLAYSRALYWLELLSKYEYQTFYKNYLVYLNLLYSPEIIFYFDCEVKTILKRIKRRGRKHEQYYSADYVQALRFAFSDLANELSRSHKVVFINTDKSSPREMAELYAPQS